MTQETDPHRRDPLGKRALFSGSASDAAERPRETPEEPGGNRRLPKVTVHCSSCDTRTTLSLTAFAVQHLPAWVWIPWKRHSHLMRCPACGQFAWHAVS